MRGEVRVAGQQFDARLRCLCSGDARSPREISLWEVRLRTADWTRPHAPRFGRRARPLIRRSRRGRGPAGEKMADTFFHRLPTVNRVPSSTGRACVKTARITGPDIFGVEVPSVIVEPMREKKAFVARDGENGTCTRVLLLRRQRRDIGKVRPRGHCCQIRQLFDRA